MAVRNDILYFNNGDVVNVSTVALISADGRALAKGTNRPPTVIHIDEGSDMAKQIKRLPTTSFSGLMGVFYAYRTLDYYNSSAFKDFVKALNDSVIWLWGNLEIGGCYIRKDYDNDNSYGFKIGGVQGFFEDSTVTSDERYFFRILETGRTYGFTKAYSGTPPIDLVFMYDENSVERLMPRMRVWSLYGLNYDYIGYKLYNEITHMYGLKQPCEDMYECTRYITWEGSLGDNPSCIFDIPIAPEGTVYPYATNYIIFDDWDEDSSYKLLSGSMWGDALDPDSEDEDPNEGGGYSSGGEGGYGSYPSETGNEDFSDPTQMAINVINSGFVTLYNPSLEGVKAFNSWLFNDVTDAISGTLKKLIADPIDYVLFLSLCHFQPPYRAQDTIHFAGINTNISANKISNQFVEIDCGTVYIGGDTNTFLDYNPNTKISVYLPYIGINDLNSDDVVGSNVHIKYYVDLLTGACICQIKCTRGLRIGSGDSHLNDVIYSFSGNCYEQIPITGTDWRGLASSLMQAVSGGVSLATGNLAGLGSIASAVITDKNNVKHSGNMGSTFGYMDKQKPYIILERPINNNPRNYQGFKGFTSNIRLKLGNLKGYTEIESSTLWCDNFNGITEDEVDLLKQITATGFYL